MTTIRIPSVGRAAFDGAPPVTPKTPGARLGVVQKEAAHPAQALYQQQATIQLRQVDRFFAGMIAKGATPEIVQAEAEAFRREMETNTRIWNKFAPGEVEACLKRLSAIRG